MGGRTLRCQGTVAPTPVVARRPPPPSGLSLALGAGSFWKGREGSRRETCSAALRTAVRGEEGGRKGKEKEERTGEAGTWRAQETGGEGERAAGPPP